MGARIENMPAGPRGRRGAAMEDGRRSEGLTAGGARSPPPVYITLYKHAELFTLSLQTKYTM
jgi:hypothetical protein